MNKTVLCIIDGLGINPNEVGNAVHAADMKNLKQSIKDFPSTQIRASGPEVGLVDEKDAGNSEVGHNAIGSGQHIRQGLALLNNKFETGDLFRGEGWQKISANAKDKKLNIIMLLSDGRTHSDLPHLFEVLKQCAKEKIKVAIHALSDGRDVSPQSVLTYINTTRKAISDFEVDAKIATLGGRGTLFMDRYETDPAMLTRGFEVIVQGAATHITDIEAAIKEEYAKRPTMTDETMPPFVIEPDWLLKNGDSILLLNYRGDRAVQTCDMFEKGKYLSQKQYVMINKCLFAGVLQYDADNNQPNLFLCSPAVINNPLSEWLSGFNVRMFAVTESVKFGHLTYFFDGNRANAFKKELDTRQNFQSDVCANMYNGRPEMYAQKITDTAIEAIKSNKYDFIKMNLANPDMVAHTGDFDATVIACKTVDKCLGDLIKTCRDMSANLIITADHGNAEMMKDAKGTPHTSHTNNPVPFVILPFALKEKVIIKEGTFGLTNIAATICDLMGIKTSPHFNPSIVNLVK